MTWVDELGITHARITHKWDNHWSDRTWVRFACGHGGDMIIMRSSLGNRIVDCMTCLIKMTS